MNRSKWLHTVCRIALWIAPGSALLGSSCGLEVRNSLIGAGADFVGQSWTTVLEALFPVQDWTGADDAG